MTATAHIPQEFSPTNGLQETALSVGKVINCSADLPKPDTPMETLVDPEQSSDGLDNEINVTTKLNQVIFQCDIIFVTGMCAYIRPIRLRWMGGLVE